MGEAIAAGVDRIELCEDLAVGGITPSEALLGWTLERTTMPIHVMIRPRGGSFVHGTAEVDRMVKDARRLLDIGAAGIVAGMLTPEGGVDEGAVRRLRDEFDGPFTFHRAFDAVSREPLQTLDQLVNLGIDRLLTSGGASTAWEGRARLAALVHHAAGRLTVMAGGSIQAAEAAALVRATGATELHVRATRAAAVVKALRSS